VRIIDTVIPKAKIDGLITACDCSLHRSEGFGVAIAEAMSSGNR
jgi:hypothetical protein